MSEDPSKMGTSQGSISLTTRLGTTQAVMAVMVALLMLIGAIEQPRHPSLWRSEPPVGPHSGGASLSGPHPPSLPAARSPKSDRSKDGLCFSVIIGSV